MTAEHRSGRGAGVAAVAAVVAPALLLAALPPALPPRLWTLFPGWAYVADGLSVGLGALLLLLAGTILAAWGPDAPAGGRRARAGWVLLLLGLGQTVFAASLGSRWLGLEVAGLALWLLAPGPPRAILLLRHLAGYPLLLVALVGGLDVTRTPGQVISATPAWVVGALLFSALVRAASTLPLFTVRHQLPTPNPQPLVLYAALAYYPLIRSLAAGPWDAWGRFAVVACGLILLGGSVAYGVWRMAYPEWRTPHTSYRIPHTAYLVGAVLLGLGLGSAAGVSGALALGAVGLAGGVLSTGAAGRAGQDGRALRLLGRLSAVGLPPFAGFAGLWLLAGALIPARYPLGLVLLLAGAALLVRSAECGMRDRDDRQSARRTPQSALPLVPLAGLLLLGGLAPAIWLDGLIRPAADTLAAGVPALSSVTVVPGLAYLAGPDSALVAAWPVLGLGVAVALAWLLVELGTMLGRRTNPPPPIPNPPSGDDR